MSLQLYPCKNPRWPLGTYPTFLSVDQKSITNSVPHMKCMAARDKDNLACDFN